MPRIIDRPIEGAGNSRQDDVRKRRGAWDKRQRWALFGELSLRKDASPAEDPAKPTAFRL